MPKVTAIQTNSRSNRKKLRVAAYCRVSTDSEAQLESLETQMAHYEKYINDHSGWEYVGLYYDEGLSGTKMANRDALLQLLADCEERKIDFIVTKSISRFSRNTTECLQMVRKLLSLNVPVYFEKEEISTAAMGSELYLTLYSTLAENESKSLAQNVTWSAQKRFQNGTYKTSSAPYGYVWNGEDLVIHPEQAEVVRMIFAEALTGNGSYRIAKKLNELGIPSARGGLWSDSSVKGILSNERYTGDVLLQKTYTDDDFNRHSNHGEKDQYIIPDHHEAIVSREDFDVAAEIIAQHSREIRIEKGSGKYQNRYAFSGKIICGECGDTFKRRHHKNRDFKYPAWCCNTHLTDKDKCSMLYIRDDALRLAFATMMNKLIFAHNVILKSYLTGLRNSPDDPKAKRIQELHELLYRNTEQRETLSKIRSQGYIDQVVYNKEINELMTQAQEYRSEITVLTQAAGKSSLISETADLLKFTEGADMLTEFDEELFERFVNRIVVFRRDEVGFELKCGLTLRERLR